MQGLPEPSSLRGRTSIPEQLTIKAVTWACKLFDGCSLELCSATPSVASSFIWHIYSIEIKSIRLHDSIVMASPWDSISYIYILLRHYFVPKIAVVTVPLLVRALRGHWSATLRMKTTTETAISTVNPFRPLTSVWRSGCPLSLANTKDLLIKERVVTFTSAIFRAKNNKNMSAVCASQIEKFTNSVLLLTLWRMFLKFLIFNFTEYLTK